jgi:hypothetical protein
MLVACTLGFQMRVHIQQHSLNPPLIYIYDIVNA